MGFEPKTTEFRSDALTNWGIRPWVLLAHRDNFVQILLFHPVVQYSHFISVIAFVSLHSCFKSNLAQVITLAVEWIDTYAIQSWKIVRSRYRKLAWVGLGSITTEFHSDALTDWAISPCVQLCTATPISSLCEVFTFPFCHFICQWLHLL